MKPRRTTRTLPAALRRRKGIAAVMAMLFVVLSSSLALGIYYSEGNSVAIADNEQYIDRSVIASETGLQYARYELQQVNWSNVALSSSATPAQAISSIYTSLGTLLNGTGNMGGHSVSLNSTTNTIYIPGETQSGSTYTPNWMATDTLGGQTYVAITASGSGASMAINIESRGENTNAHTTPIIRAMEVNFSAAAVTGPATVFNYGIVSNGEIMLNGNMHITGTNSAAMGSVLSLSNPAINVNNSNSFSGDFSYAYTGTPSWNYGSLTVDGYLSSSSSFAQHVHGGVSASLPTISTAVYQTAVQAAPDYQLCTTLSAAVNPNVTTISNVELKAGNYVFNKNVTISGIMLLDQGANVTFNKNMTINGCIVSANYSASGSQSTIIMDGTAAQAGFPATANYTGEIAAIPNCPFILDPNATVTFNSTTTANGSMVGYGFTFNGTVSLTMNGSLISMGTGNLQFNSGGNINITGTSTNATPTGVSGVTILQFTVTPASYVELNP